MEDSQVIGRKHFLAYLQILLVYGFLMLPVTAFLIWLGTTTRFRVPAWLLLILLGIDLLIAFGAFRSFMENKAFTWTLTDEGVDIRRGWLFWQKSHFDLPYDTIFEAYYTFGFFAKILGYGTCVIRRTEGVTSAYEATFIARPGAIVGAINKKVKELRVEAKQARIMQAIAPAPLPAFQAETAKSPAEQIRELIALKTEGAITAEEFETMKRRVVEGGTA
jgi:uncharacterized membrane protein YdbT with pleckstrin-like domain